MDKVVDHLLVFHGDGQIKDFPGNYTQYREWEAMQPASAETKAASPAPRKSHHSVSRRRLSFKERREFEQLEEDITALEAEKKQIEEALSGGELDVAEITRMSKRLPQLNNELDDKSMRWLELSEFA